MHVRVSFLKAMGRLRSLGRLRFSCTYEISKIPSSHLLNLFTRLGDVTSCSGIGLDS